MVWFCKYYKGSMRDRTQCRPGRMGDGFFFQTLRNVSNSMMCPQGQHAWRLGGKGVCDKDPAGRLSGGQSHRLHPKHGGDNGKVLIRRAAL